MTVTSICKRLLGAFIIVFSAASVAAQPTQSFSRVYFGDGTSGAPSISFRSQTGLGIYRVSSGTIGVTGTLVPNADSTNNLGSGSLRWNRTSTVQATIGANSVAWLTDGNNPFVNHLVINGTQTSGGTNDMYGTFIQNSLNLTGNTTKTSYGTYVEGSLAHATAKTFVNHFGFYGAAYTGDTVGDGSGWFSGVTGDAEWSGTGDIANLAAVDAAYWGSYDPGVGTLGAQTLIAGVHVGQPFHGTTAPDNVASVDIEDVTAGGSISTTASAVWAIRYTASGGSKGGIGRGGAFVDVPSTLTVSDSGNGSPATSTLTPTSSLVKVTCNDADGCDVTLGESDLYDGQQVRIVNVSANTVNFADTSGVSEIAGAAALGQWDTISLLYVSDRWVETGRSNN